MKIVAESQETIRVPISATQAGAFVDPSTAGARVVSVALKPQGTSLSNPGDFTITGSWETNVNTTPDSYWVAFTAPGNLTRGTAYECYVKLATVGADTPILLVPSLIEAT